MLTHSDLKKGVKFILNNEPHEVLEGLFMFKGRGSSVVQAKIKNLVTGNVISKTFHPGEDFEEAEISKIKARFLYSHKDKFFFCQEQNPAERFGLAQGQIGKAAQYLKPNTVLDALIFENKVINVSLPIKMQLKVIEAPPGVKGDRAQGGTKVVTLETGAKINAPLFIEEGDTIEVNTETDEYGKRMEK